ncbi:MAG: prepilin-type N-terminal cleavage/methylation domain-containing protein [Candidatus Wallbacteria bacterium]|nr:prepilin-type N-terminal cleavage/methylation domain-containing protein [Candidatus Wallbacteria bacterium]
MRNQRTGITLVELLVAASILALALAPILDLLAKNSRQTRFSEDRLYATMRARTVLERYRPLRPSKLAAMFPPDGSGSAQIAKDSLVSIAAMPVSTDDSELEDARRREGRFDVRLGFIPEPDGRAGQLVARVSWSSANSTKASTLTASEWVSDRRR